MKIGNNTQKSNPVTDWSKMFWEGFSSVLPQNPFTVSLPTGQMTLSQQGILVTQGGTTTTSASVTSGFDIKIFGLVAIILIIMIILKR